MNGSHLDHDRKNLEGRHLIPPVGNWFHLTTSGRMEPSFFIAGVQKGGTTSLAQYLIAHPSIIQPQRKDIYFFNNAENFGKGKKWYKAHFPHRLYARLKSPLGSSRLMTFDPTPNYLAAEGAAARIAGMYPKTKIILLLRNPAERAWSNYRMCVHHGFEKLSFEDALLHEDERIQHEKELIAAGMKHSYVLQRLTYRTQGLYAQQLKEWKKHFASEQFLILKSEDLFESPQKTYDNVTSFLGIASYDKVKFEVYNRNAISDGMNCETRKELTAFFAAPNEELYSLIGRNMNWN